jgi:ubiquinone/menaquinone biosynthesis C-methylase UbiE
VEGSIFVDVCAGPGTFTVALMKRISPDLARSIHFIVSDFAEGMVNEARTAVQAFLPDCTNVDFEVIDVQDITLATESADVISHMFGYFVPDRSKAFTEVYRLLKPGGTAVIGTWKYAGMAPLLNDFLVHLGKNAIPKALEVVHSCADGDAFYSELLGYGYSEVTVHENERVFELGFEDHDALLGMFANPMISKELTDFTNDHLLSEWNKFLRSVNLKFPVDLERNILFVKYIGNLVICVK